MWCCSLTFAFILWAFIAQQIDSFVISAATTQSAQVRLHSTSQSATEAVDAPTLASQFVAARSSFSVEEGSAGGSGAMLNYVQALRHAKASLLDALESSGGLYTEPVAQYADQLMSVNPVHSPLNCRDLLEGEWLFASSAHDVPLGSSSSLADVLTSMGVSSTALQEMQQSSSNAQLFEKTLRPVSRHLHFTNDDDRRPQLHYTLITECDSAQITLSGTAPKRSASSAELQRIEWTVDLHSTSEQSEQQQIMFNKQDTSPEDWKVLGSKQLLHIVYLDQDMAIVTRHPRGVVDAEHFGVLMKLTETPRHQPEQEASPQ
jgi:hypothetical protein